MLEQPDGKVLIAGYFTSYDGDTSIKRIQRFNTDLSVDTSFDSGTSTNSDIYALALQTDGKILIGGAFSTYQGTARRRIARLNTDGSLDTSFVIGTGFSNSVWAIAVQTDGKILVGGEFATYSGTSRARVARLNTDGSLDTTFPDLSINGAVYQLEILSDGKILIGGGFTSVSGQSRGFIAKLNSDGTLDSFASGTSFNGDVISLDIDPDGKIMCGGFFGSYSGQSRNRIARLNSNGTLDTTFIVGSGITGDYVFDISSKNGKYVISGNFSSYDGVAVGGFLRLNNDGSRDTTFVSGTGVDWDPAVFSLTSETLTNGNTILTGEFTEYNGTSTPNFILVDPFGNLLNCL
jgi:uncharacterized delta-60 repeat protein